MILPFTMVMVRGILRLYPARFRDRFSTDVIASIRSDLERARADGVLAVLVCAARAIGDAMAGVIPEHRPGRPGIAAWRSLGADLRDAIRSLRHAGSFTTVAVVMLALGIASATTIFSVVDAVVLRGLPFDHHDRIVAVLEDNPKRNISGATMPQIYLVWRLRQQSFAQFAGTFRNSYRVRNAGGGLDSIRGMRVTRDFFAVLRVKPALGNPFSADDEIPGQHRRAILSYAFWQRSFGGAPDVVGRDMEIDGERWQVAGVMPRGFSYPVGSAQAIDIFAPLAFRPQDHSVDNREDRRC